MRKQIENKVAAMSVIEMRKAASQHGIKNASKYKRAELQQMLINTLITEAKKVVKTGKRVKAEKVVGNDVEILAKQLLEGLEDITGEQLMKTNRKVLIVVMKMLHCSKWYRTYDKKTMVEKIVAKKTA